ncbi:venom acid phosphatase Acph-1 [Megachile rotundata]|uniref:venom acid phosphatase Acph-1 n=1 Tax=Megachile rotundata TaxID=143995 RepID=UPI000258D7FE|nr:PREDICTED: venom acid phosphatase Acph-1-like [Megachile rotundata]
MLLDRMLIVTVISIVVTVANCDLELQMLHLVFRHGDKVPHREYQNYPTDPYKDYSYYPMGSGDLTNQGKLREYRIGTMLRERYNQYFGPDYWPEKIYARSTYIPRTQLSLQLVLAGLFPPSEKQTWNPQLPWIPAATFSVPYEDDNLLFPHHCPRYREEYDKFLRQKNVQDIVGKYRNVMNYLSKHSGKAVNTTSAVTYMYNLLKEQAAQNLSLPKWTETVYPTPMKEIIALDFKLRSYTRTLKRLNGGLLLRKMIEDIKTYQMGKLEPYDRKAFLFSAHEMNVAAVVRALGLDEPSVPAYGATVILETLRDKKGSYYVRVLLWTGVSEQLIIETIPGCVELCPFDQFLSIVKDVIPRDDEYYCHPGEKLNKPENSEYVNSSTSNIILAKTWFNSILSVFFTLLFTSYVIDIKR